MKEKRQLRKKALSLFLSLALVLGMVPMGAISFGDDFTEHNTGRMITVNPNDIYSDQITINSDFEVTQGGTGTKKLQYARTKLDDYNKLDELSWRDDKVFAGLKPNSQYTFYVRQVTTVEGTATNSEERWSTAFLTKRAHELVYTESIEDIILITPTSTNGLSVEGVKIKDNSYAKKDDLPISSGLTYQWEQKAEGETAFADFALEGNKAANITAEALKTLADGTYIFRCKIDHAEVADPLVTKKIKVVKSSKSNIITITPHAPASDTKVYDGKAFEGISFTSAEGATLETKYYKLSTGDPLEEAKNFTSVPDDADKVAEDEAKNAGVYIAEASVASTDPTYTALPALIAFEIKQAPLSLKSATLKPKDYDGYETAEIDTAELSGCVNGETLKLDVDFQNHITRFLDSNAGTGKVATVEVALKNTKKAKNYYFPEGAGRINLTGQEIKKATITIDGATLAEKFYDRTDIGIVTEVTIQETVDFYLDKDYTATAVYDSADVSAERKATVTVNLTSDGLKNYEFKDGKNTIVLESQEIKKKEITTIDQGQYIKAGETITFDLKRFLPSDLTEAEKANVAFGFANGSNKPGNILANSGDIFISGSQLTIIPKSSLNYGDSQIIQFQFSLNNYIFTDAFLMLVATTDTILSIEATDLQKVYDGKELEPKITFENGGNPEALNESEYNISIKKVDDSTITEAITAGRYTMKVAVNKFGFAGEAYFALNITKRPLWLKVDDKTIDLGENPTFTVNAEDKGDTGMALADYHTLTISDQTGVQAIAWDGTSTGKYRTVIFGYDSYFALKDSADADVKDNYEYKGFTDGILTVKLTAAQKSALDTAITGAKAKLAGVTANDATDPSKVESGVKYISTAEHAKITNLINATEYVRNSALDYSQRFDEGYVDDTIADLMAGVTEFEAKIKTGTKVKITTGGGGGGGSTTSTPVTTTTTPIISPTTTEVTVPSTANGGVSLNLTLTNATGDAKVDLNPAKVDELIKAAVDGNKGEIALNLSEVKQDINQVTVPTSALAQIAEVLNDEKNNIDEFKIETKTGSVSFDKDALTTIAGAATGADVTLGIQEVSKSDLTPSQVATLGAAGKDAIILDLSLMSGGASISQFNGIATVSIPYAPAKGQDPKSVTVWFISDKGALTPCKTSYDAEAGKLSFTTTHFSKYVVGYFPINDVKSTDKNYTAITKAYTNGWMKATSSKKFSPKRKVNGAMVMTALYRASGKTDKAKYDVQTRMSKTPALSWAVKKGLVDKKFAPNKTINMKDAARIINKYKKNSVKIKAANAKKAVTRGDLAAMLIKLK